MSGNTRTLLTVLVIVLVAAIVIGFLASRSNKTKTTPTPKTLVSNIQTVTTVKYDGKAFTPADISVKAGTTIRFVNNSSSGLWVESTNSMLPTLNSTKVLDKNGSYNFTFTQKGSVKYDNKQSSSQTGKVTVL